MEEYTEHILPTVHRRQKQLARKSKEMIFQEDNDGGHGTKSLDNIAARKKSEYNLNYIDDWPPNSPDLNPIENVWRILKSRVKQWKPRTAEELKEAILAEWEAITMEEINRLIMGDKMSIKQRLQQCVDRNGYATQF